MSDLREASRPLAEALARQRNATEEIRSILRDGLSNLEAEKKASWHAKKNPSVSDAGKCPRQVAYSLKNLTPSNPLTEDSLANFAVGTAVEGVMAALLTRAGAKFIREGRVAIPAGETTVTGRRDFEGVTLLMRGAIIELKTTSSRAMSWMLKRGEEGRSEHRRQLNLYLYGAGAESGYLVYWIKDAVRGEPVWHAWHVPLDKNLAESDLWNLAAIDKMVKGGTIPERPDGYKRSAFPCSYCDYATFCWSKP